MTENKKPDKEDELNSGKRALNSYAFYTGMGFQMIAIIGIFAFIGYKIDDAQSTQTPLYTAFFSLAGVFIALYVVIRSVKKNKP